jgi:hypothetical protein
MRFTGTGNSEIAFASLSRRRDLSHPGCVGAVTGRVLGHYLSKSFKNRLFGGKGDRAKKGHKSAECKIFGPLLCQLSYLAEKVAKAGNIGVPGFLRKQIFTRDRSRPTRPRRSDNAR